MSILKKVFPKNKKDDEATDEKSGKPHHDLETAANLAERLSRGGKEKENNNIIAVKSEINAEEKISNEGRNIADFNYGKILIRPLMTEKALNLSKAGKYFFEVDASVNKIQIKNAIKKVYGVLPADVNIISKKGKKTGMSMKVKGKRKDWKKAIISLEKGKTIDVHQFENKK
ncbi:MAG: 50S ribosomal protein L23 [bacterium]